MSQKVVLVTGGSSGIGKAIGSYLRSRGHAVYGTTRNKSKYPGFEDFDLLEMDVRNTDSIQRAVAEIISNEGRLDVLVNNAGIGITGPIEETPHEEIVKAFDTNFHGPLHVAKAVLPQMRSQGSGTIINITSIAGYMGLPFRGIYSATKGALELATEAMRIETKGSGVRVCSLAPGAFATKIAEGRYHVPISEGSSYKQPYERTLRMVNEDVDGGKDPILIAKTVLRIMDAADPKVHYRVGAPMQKFSVFLKKILPDKLYEKLLMNHYKL